MWALALFFVVLTLFQSAPEVPLELKFRLVEQINQDRKQAGLAPVEYSAELSRAADAHCREMLRENYTSHWNRAGWKPYLRYAQAGIRDFTAENIWSTWQTDFRVDAASLWEEIRAGHRSFMAELPPRDAHRKNVLDPWHTHAGIGVAYDNRGMRLIEVFGARYAELEPLPARATLRENYDVRGRLLRPGLELSGIGVFYEPLPQPMSLLELFATGVYGLPDEEWLERPHRAGWRYAEGNAGTIVVDRSGGFAVPLRFWKKRPGVYTVAVWVGPPGKKAFIGAMTSVIVQDQPGKPSTLPPVPGAGGRLPGASASRVRAGFSAPRPGG